MMRLHVLDARYSDPLSCATLPIVMHIHSPAHPLHNDRRFAIAVGLNLAFTAGEIAFGLLASSAALLADALHNFADVAGLLVAWVGIWCARRPATRRFTFGLRSATIYAAIFNAALLLFATGALALEALHRVFAPGIVDGEMVSWVAAIGVVVNGISAYLFAGDHAHDLNLHGTFIHLVSDTLVSVGVCITGFMILRTGWNWLDPAATLVIVAVIVALTWRLLRDSASLGLHGVPANIELAAVEGHLATQTGIAAVHDLHVWALSTTEAALTAHLVMPAGHPGDAWLDTLANSIHGKFGIQHATFQVELDDPQHRCALELNPHSH